MLEALEYRSTRYGLHPTGIHVIDPALDLGFPLVAKIDSVQLGGRERTFSAYTL